LIRGAIQIIRLFILGKQLPPIMSTTTVITPTARLLKENIANKQPLSVNFRLMLLESVICTAMSGNGVPMVGMIAMQTNLMISTITVALYGYLVISLLIYCVAVLGTIIRGAVARRIGTGTMRIIGTTTTVFGSFFPSFHDCLCPFAWIFLSQ
jgi:hypothetical protein